MRTNILLVAGEHYTNKSSTFYNRIRDSENVSKEKKLKLTKNYVKKIIGEYENRLLSLAPNTTVLPNNETEEQDIKAAELNKSVWDFYKRKLKLRSKIREFAENYMQLGECCCKIFFDPTLGQVRGYSPKTNSKGEELYDENQKLIPDKESPVMTGDFVFEKVLAFNILRAPDAQSIDDSPYLIIRKMMPYFKLKKLLNDDELFNKIKDDEGKTFLVFDSDKATYSKEKKDILVREHYYRPCVEYPNGYFYICTQNEILFHGELPFGIWPIAHAGCDRVATSARYRSPIKQMRPSQIEINRTSSEIATTQITLGSDKLIMNYGSKLTEAGKLPGVRAMTVTGGSPPTVLPGRGGEQYIPWLEKNINELNDLMNQGGSDPTRNGQLDPYALLFSGMKNRQQYFKYGEAFEDFLVEITNIFLELAKQYLDETDIIPIIGRSEIVNIQEFKNTDKNKYRIAVDAISVDAETMLGKQLAINHTLQYVGKDLDKNEIGKFIRMMPFMNGEKMFEDLTLNYDTARNIILALDRGNMPAIRKYDEHEYLVKKLTDRMRKPDFSFLSPVIQNNYEQYTRQCEEIIVQKQIELQRAKQGYIPTGGYLVTCDFYVDTGEGETKRARVPYEALNWLMKQLEAQGEGINKLEGINQGALADMSNRLIQLNNNGQASPIPGAMNGY